MVVKVLDVSYGEDNGFKQAIELAAETLANVKFVQERKLICKYMEEIAMDKGKFCLRYDERVGDRRGGHAHFMERYAP